MKSQFVRVSMVFLLMNMSMVPTWSEDVAVLVAGGLFEGVFDPNNDDFDREFIMETFELEEPGIGWLVQHLEDDLGHTVNLINSDEDDPAEVEEMNDLIIVTESLGSGSVGGDYAGSSKPFITTEFFLMDDMGLTGGASEFTGGAFNDGSVVTIAEPNHPIAQGLPETFGITVDDPETGEPAQVTFGVVTNPSILTTGTVVGVLPTSNNASDSDAALPENVPFLIAVDTGEAGNDARWAFIGYSDVNRSSAQGGEDDLQRTLALLNEDGIQLLDNTIAWALGEDGGSSINDWSIR